MYRFLSWMAIGTAAAFLVVATASFSLPVIKWLAFSIGFGTMIVSGSIGFGWLAVIGRSLVPSPPAITTAFMTDALLSPGP